MFTWLTDTQLSGMWTALSQWWTWLLHIAIQLMPYAIAFIIILLIFWLIKNWSKLRNKRWSETIIFKNESEYKEFKKYYNKNWDLKKKYRIR